MASELHVDAIKHSGGTSAMTIDSTGRVTTPARPAFRAYNNTNVWVEQTHGSTLPIAFNATDYNIGSHYNTSTYKFTAPVTGVYCFYATLYTHADGNARYIYIQKNDAFYSGMIISNTTTMNQNGSLYDQLYLTANDTVRIAYHHTSDTANSYYAGDSSADGAYSFFCGHFIG